MVRPVLLECGAVLFPVTLLVLLMPHSKIHHAVSGCDNSGDHYANGSRAVRWVEHILQADV